MNEESAFILQGSVSSVLVAFFRTAVLRMIPYSIAAIPLIALDLLYGVRAAKCRGERARFSTAIRRTITKMFSYACWLILATAMAIAFQVQWIEWVVLGTVYVNELASIIGNYLETKGLEVSWKDVWRAVAKVVGQKVNVDTDGIDPGSFVKPIDEKEEEK